MKALVLDAWNQLNYRDFPDPVYGSREVLVGVKACGICGSDVHGLDGSTGRRQPPLIMGHEASGVILETGSEVVNWKVGDRVTFDSTIYPLDDWYTRKGRYNLSDNRQVLGVSPGEYRRHGAFADKVVIPEHILYKIPDKVSFVEAAMVEPVAVAAHALNLSDVRPGADVLVAGVGMVGVFVVMLLKLAGVRSVIAIDVDDFKLNQAKQCGADHIFHSNDPHLHDKITELTNNRGVDVAFEVVGISDTVHKCIQNTRKGGNVVLVGNLSPGIDFPLQQVVTREIKVQGSCAINGEYEMVLDLMASSKIDVKPQISAVAPLSEGSEWFSKLKAGEPGLNKVILVPD